jgi:hypothetical protein
MKKSTHILFINSLLLLLCTILLSSSLTAQNNYFYPDKGDTVKFDRNEFFTFLWPEKMLPDTPFTFVLVPLLPGQTPEEALRKNRPIYTDSAINSYYINYPWYAPDLNTGAYVWQISDYKSPILIPHLIIIRDSLPRREEVIRYRNMYAYLKEQQDAARQFAYDKWLYIHYKEPYWVADTQNLRFRVLDVRRNVLADTYESGAVKTGAFPPIPIQYGYNWLTIKLEAVAEWNTSYTLEVWNAKGEILVLPFYCTSSCPFILKP